MTRKQRRSVFIGASLAVLGLAVGLVLYALEDSIVFFYSPSEVIAKDLKPGQRFRLGGLVEQGSVVRGDSTEVRFAVTDKAQTIHVIYKGVLPDLFREEQGVIAEGRLNESGLFVADTVLAKHDENYMPREVYEALKGKALQKARDEGSPADTPAQTGTPTDTQ